MIPLSRLATTNVWPARRGNSSAWVGDRRSLEVAVEGLETGTEADILEQVGKVLIRGQEHMVNQQQRQSVRAMKPAMSKRSHASTVVEECMVSKWGKSRRH